MGKQPFMLSGTVDDNVNHTQHMSNTRVPLKAFAACLLILLLWWHIPFRSIVITVASSSDELAREDWRVLPVGTIRWWTCPPPTNPTGPEGECGFLIVPTDYTDSTAGTTKVALGRKRATAAPRLGTVIFGAGGPGGPGGLVVRLGGEGMQASVTGEQWDIVGIDPRGIGDTEPTTQCLLPGQNNALTANTVLLRNFDYSSSVPEAQLRQSLLRQQEEMDALVETQYRMCGVSMGGKVRYMGTTIVVRDIERVVSALEGEGTLINYFGGSYGSIIGQYLVNMFPERVGKVMVEGIVDVVAWANQPMYKSYRQWLSSTEDAYTWFTTECAKAGPQTCELARREDEGESEPIRERLEAFFDRLYERPLTVADRRFWGIVTSGMARTLLFRMLQMPTVWPTTAVVLSQAILGDGQALLMLDTLFAGYKDLERQAVSCNDAPKPPLYDPPTNEQLVDEILSVSKQVSKFAFSVLTAEPDAQCHYWPVNPPERFTGPWNHTLKNPILVQSNTADPITPISSARLLKDLLGGSAILVLQNGPGHGTTSFPTLCTINITRAYFTDGILPEDGHVCELETPLFPAGNHDDQKIYTIAERNQLSAAEKLFMMMKGFDIDALSSSFD
ncbi:hypothetical protein DACRYDRAFT_112199 [Dacryopinax primogenitus]|uniref:Peptidase S33 tripeptidyl aminopeptidase-like C-terminal domain-containing protein n=1 Tax=Dacryopinax primogenitus (strain DJM 731) TaxID=1858805 RepID=M5FP72_DACPD|nr:uncharacterized protein DACRYDRAFT_112199 [Dacryopinax primogenitus]EJT96858.1 hypothetical protein DACRYDRAFT_112199 [Dacryopinax primogenitus]